MQTETKLLKSCVVSHHLATLFNNTNAASNPLQGGRLCTVYSAKQLRNLAKFTAKLRIVC